MSAAYSVEFPTYFDVYEPEIEAKGYFADLTLRIGRSVLRPMFYDLQRLGQECEDAFASGSPCVSAPLLIVVPAVNRATILAALDALAAGNFADLLPDSSFTSGS